MCLSNNHFELESSLSIVGLKPFGKIRWISKSKGNLNVVTATMEEDLKIRYWVSPRALIYTRKTTGIGFHHYFPKDRFPKELNGETFITISAGSSLLYADIEEFTSSRFYILTKDNNLPFSEVALINIDKWDKVVYDFIFRLEEIPYKCRILRSNANPTEAIATFYFSHKSELFITPIGDLLTIEQLRERIWGCA